MMSDSYVCFSNSINYLGHDVIQHLSLGTSGAREYLERYILEHLLRFRSIIRQIVTKIEDCSSCSRE